MKALIDVHTAYKEHGQILRGVEVQVAGWEREEEEEKEERSSEKEKEEGRKTLLEAQQ